MTKEQVAVICHEANKAYCLGLDDSSQRSWNEAPQWQRDSAIKGVEFHLGVLRAGGKPSPSASHESWLAEKREQGWEYGPEKDADRKLHPCFVPYDALSLEQRGKDYVFAGIVESMFGAGLLK